MIPFTEDRDHATTRARSSASAGTGRIERAEEFREFVAPARCTCLGCVDLAHTRFSPHRPTALWGPELRTARHGRRTPTGEQLRYWSAARREGTFYAYAYPEPPGYRDATVEPAGARWDDELGEFVLPYELVRTAPDPDAALLAFVRSTYVAAASTAKWDRDALERRV